MILYRVSRGFSPSVAGYDRNGADDGRNGWKDEKSRQTEITTLGVDTCFTHVSVISGLVHMFSTALHSARAFVPTYDQHLHMASTDKQVGPGRWLTMQLFLFGLVSTFQAFQSGYGAFIATRFLLGVTESGYIPGGLWTLSTWYTRTETAKRVMIFYFGNQFGQARCVSLIPRSSCADGGSWQSLY
jgi:hypothetical protein